MLKIQGETCVAIEDVDGDCEIVNVEDGTTCADEKLPQDIGIESGEKQPLEDNSCEKPDVITERDIEMFEMLDIRDRNAPKVSQTATPNNTPLGNQCNVTCLSEDSSNA